MQRSFAICGVLFLLATGAQGRESALKLEASLVENRITLGEPIILNYRLSTDGLKTVEPDLGRCAEDWLKIQIKDKDGTLLPILPDYRPVNLYERLTPIYWITSQHGHQGQMVVSQMFQISYPGRYSVLISPQIPRSYSVNADGSKNQVFYPIEKQELVLTVERPDVAKIGKIAQYWFGKTQSKDWIERKFALAALFSMPENRVLSYWLDLVDNAVHNPAGLVYLDDVDDQLSRLGTPTAISLLETIRTKKLEFLRPELEEIMRKAKRSAQ